MVRNLFAIPNGAHLAGSERQRAIQARRLKDEGAVSGVADLFLSVPSSDYHGFYIEMKTQTGKQTENQKQFEQSVTAQGYKYAICRGVDEFMSLINEYLR